MDRIKTGISQLDILLAGGFPENTVILLSGGPGTGKTLFGLNFMLAGAVKNERCCYLTLNENKNELLRACMLEQLKPVGTYLDKNLVVEHLEMGGEINLDYFEDLFHSYPLTNRIVIDNLNKLLIHAENKRQYRITLSKTVKLLREHIGCTILICETEENKIDTGNGEAFECDGVVHLSFLDLEEKPKRTLEIHKMRYTPIDPKIKHEFEITNRGLRLTETKII